MRDRTNGRVNQSRNGVAAVIPIERPGASPRIVAVYRRPDNTLCHARCGRQLILQGVRGQEEADFYCYTCLTHVSLLVSMLDEVPVTV